MNKGIKQRLNIEVSNCNIIIYGAGAYGRLTYDFLKKYKNVLTKICVYNKIILGREKVWILFFKFFVKEQIYAFFVAKIESKRGYPLLFVYYIYK